MKNMNIAYFVSSHGFGHATRSTAVMEALIALDPGLDFHIFSTVPTWLFQETLNGNFEYHEIPVDIGLVQKSSLAEDLEGTIHQLDEWLPFSPERIKNLAEMLIQQKCRLVICDIAPLGVAVAEAANIPSLLIENFTWDWIYEGYLNTLDQQYANRLSGHIKYLRQWFDCTTFHIQTSPVCSLIPEANLVTGPVSRRHKEKPEEIRRQLDLSMSGKMVLITMGGIPWDYTSLQSLEKLPETVFLIPGASNQRVRNNNLILLPHHSGFLHPDLIRSADALIGKVGYSTVAEAYRAGIPFGYIDRPLFRESATMISFIKKKMKGTLISKDLFAGKNWQKTLTELLELPRIHRNEPDAADQIARFIIQSIS